MANAIWLMYLADVVGSLAVVGGLGVFVALGYAAIARLSTAIDDEPCPPSVKPALIIAAVLAGAVSLIPSKTTIYAVAAVSVGEQALNTPTGDKAMRALNAWLDRQIAGEEESK